MPPSSFTGRTDPVPGGCERCDAYQTAGYHPDDDAVLVVTVHHDDWCPRFVRLNRRRALRRARKGRR